MKQILRKCTFVLTLILSSISSSIAQVLPSTAIIDTQAGEIIGTELDPGTCSYIFYFPVYATNLIPHPDQENYQYHFILPADADPIYLKYSIAGVTGIVLLEDFAFMQELQPSGLSLYWAVASASRNFQGICRHETGDISFEVTTELVDEFGDPYPYHNNDHPEGIFSCEVFCNGCPVVTESDEISELGDFEYSCLLQAENLIRFYTYEIDCDICNAEPLVGEDKAPIVTGDEEDLMGFMSNNENNSSLNRNHSTVKESLITTTRFSPNPFDSNLNLQIQSEEEDKSVIIFFDASGKEVHLQTINLNKGDNQISFNTNNWQPGVYFGQIKLSGSIEYFKCIKMK